MIMLEAALIAMKNLPVQSFHVIVVIEKLQLLVGGRAWQVGHERRMHSQERVERCAPSLLRPDDQYLGQRAAPFGLRPDALVADVVAWIL